MRHFGKLLLASTLLITSIPALSNSNATSAAQIYEEADELERGALLLMTRSRQAQEFVEDELSGQANRSTTRKAIRLTRQLSGLALQLADLITERAPLAELETCLEEVEFVYFQVARTKSELQRKFRPERREINKKFNSIRSSFFYVKTEINSAL